MEQSIAGKVRSYGIDNIDMPKATRIAVQERLDTFYRDALAARDEGTEERMRAVATQALSLPTDVVAALNGEKKYRAAMKHWEAYETWKSQRNPARADLEREHGYDTKHAMHLVRLMRMALERVVTVSPADPRTGAVDSPNKITLGEVYDPERPADRTTHSIARTSPRAFPGLDRWHFDDAAATRDPCSTHW